jgi:hypothetical protein
MQPCGGHLIRMQMGASFDQSLHLIVQPRLRCQEERRVALAIAQVD